MIDFDGYRPNVGIVICNRKGQVLWAKRCGQNSWQFPQGGINEQESPEQAMFRELYEEVGLQQKDVKILHVTKYWLRYKLPKRLLRHDSKPVCIGQKQRWFLLQLVADEKNINMKTTKSPEFDGWRWVSFWYPVRQVVSFKREVYRKAMKEFAGVLFSARNRGESRSGKPFFAAAYEDKTPPENKRPTENNRPSADAANAENRRLASVAPLEKREITTPKAEKPQAAKQETAAKPEKTAFNPHKQKKAGGKGKRRNKKKKR